MTMRNDKMILGILFIFLFASGIALIAAVSGDLFGKEEASKIALQVIPGEIQEVDIENDNGLRIYEVDIANEDSVKEVSINQYGEILKVEDEEIDVPITGSALDEASRVALNYIGEGRVTDSEIGDEEGYYEIEITLDNGKEVDVHLDKNFNVLSTEYS